MLTSQYGSLVPVGSDACKSQPSMMITVSRPTPCPKTDRAEMNGNLHVKTTNWKRQPGLKEANDFKISLLPEIFHVIAYTPD